MCFNYRLHSFYFKSKIWIKAYDESQSFTMNLVLTFFNRALVNKLSLKRSTYGLWHRFCCFWHHDHCIYFVTSLGLYTKRFSSTVTYEVKHEIVAKTSFHFSFSFLFSIHFLNERLCFSEFFDCLLAMNLNTVVS